MRPIASLSTLALTLLFASTPQAQSQKSPKPQEEKIELKGFLTEGGITNIVEGRAFYLHDKGPPQTLTPRKALENGDVINVGGDGRVEVLLNPGIYLRLFSNTEVTLLDVSPDNLKVKLSKGSAILEILGFASRTKTAFV